MRTYGVPITMMHGMTDKDLKNAISYGTHASANKEQSFLRGKLSEQLQAEHVDIFSLAVIRHLPRLWLYLLANIPQTGRKTRLIYDFL